MVLTMWHVGDFYVKVEHHLHVHMFKFCLYSKYPVFDRIADIFSVGFNTNCQNIKLHCKWPNKVLNYFQLLSKTHYFEDRNTVARYHSNIVYNDNMLLHVNLRSWIMYVKSSVCVKRDLYINLAIIISTIFEKQLSVNTIAILDLCGRRRSVRFESG